ncbi:hypothetical protein KFE25_005354 [Diacronema lutheri]|uniref:Uncharacterized protein n=1 Tax=Diacronema lutheri TaxID=2081491 RepID=A0A8J5XSK3_DIALT|nr:hypothetical protein KFE25_005354 [Diacronema lutheri]
MDERALSRRRGLVQRLQLEQRARLEAPARAVLRAHLGGAQHVGLGLRAREEEEAIDGAKHARDVRHALEDAAEGAQHLRRPAECAPASSGAPIACTVAAPAASAGESSAPPSKQSTTSGTRAPACAGRSFAGALTLRPTSA